MSLQYGKTYESVLVSTLKIETRFICKLYISRMSWKPEFFTKMINLFNPKNTEFVTIIIFSLSVLAAPVPVPGRSSQGCSSESPTPPRCVSASPLSGKVQYSPPPFKVSLYTGYTNRYFHFLAHLAKGNVRFCHHLSSIDFSHFNLLLWNPSAKWTETW